MTALQAASQIDDLINHQASKSISMIMPTYSSGPQVKQNAIRFKNLVTEAIQQLVADGETESAAETRLRPLRELERDDRFWQHQSAGLAVYSAEGQLTTVVLHESPAEVVCVSEHFYLTPVALDAAAQKRCLVLTLTWDEAKLYVASRTEVEAWENDLFPVALRDVVLPPDTEEQLQFRTQTNLTGGTMFHGQGEGEDVIESDRKRFLSEVAKRIVSLREQPPLKLIAVGTKDVLGEFASVGKVEPEHTVTASPAGLDAHELTQRVLEAVNSNDAKADEAHLGEQLGTALATGQASRKLEQINEAASTGRVQTLLVSPRLVEEAREGASDKRAQINLAVIHTLQNGGEVAPCSAAVLDTDDVAAIYRY